MYKSIVVYCAIFLTFASCKKEEFDIINLNGNRITALGHAGMGVSSTYPINTVESIYCCLSQHMDGSEFDVQMTKDSVLVLCHYQDLSENTNLSGTVNSHTWDEIKNGHYKSTPYLNYSIASVEQLFSNVDNLQQYKFSFDCKFYTDHEDNQFYETYINAITRLVTKYQMDQNVYVEAPSLVFLKLFKNKAPHYKLFMYSISFEKGLDNVLSSGITGISISTRDITKEQIKIAHDHNVMVTIWNTHSESDHIEAIHKNPDIIQTDNVKNLLKLLR